METENEINQNETNNKNKCHYFFNDLLYPCISLFNYDSEKIHELEGLKFWKIVIILFCSIVLIIFDLIVYMPKEKTGLNYEATIRDKLLANYFNFLYSVSMPIMVVQIFKIKKMIHLKEKEIKSISIVENLLV